MKIITRTLMVDGNRAIWTDDKGHRKSPPEIAIGTKVTLRLDLRSTENAQLTGIQLPVNFADVNCDNYYFALDNDYDQDTAPKLLKTSGLVLSEANGHVYLDVEMPSTAGLPGLSAAVAKNEFVELKGEIGGYMSTGSSAEAAFVIRFPVIIANRVYIEGDAPTYVEENPEYLTAVQVMAIINNLTIPEKGEPGKSAYQVAVDLGYTGTAVEWLESLEGEAGLSSYEIAVANGYTDTVEAWLMSLKGNPGEPGKSAYQLALDNGYQGTVTQWLADHKGAAGEPGQDLKFDAVGELTELDAYNDEPAGFTFASFVTDAETNLTTIYFYLKKSNATGDWFPAQLINFRNGVDGENVAIIPPAEFGARPAGTTYFAFAQANYPAAWISAVVIDTEEGELQLPYNSIAGVTKIVKQADKFYIHFGTGCPAFTSGRAYFAQGVTTLDIVPVDPPPAEGAVYYGYIPASVAGDTPKVSTITQAMLDDPASSIVTAEAVALDKTSLGIVPAGALVVVAIPAASGLVATKFDGIADKVPFALNNGATGTGSNGVEVVLNSVIYKLYGEFKLNDAELFIYID